MQFVDNKKVSKTVLAKLDKYNNLYKGRWQIYISDKANNAQPNDSFWKDDDIRVELIKIFYANCGYCGKYINYRENNGKKRFSGQVEHYVPKSVSALDVYNWFNYIWSCPDCNIDKSNSYDANCEILNPTIFDDCKYLLFNNDGYFIDKKAPNYSTLKKRFDKTVKETTINTNEHPQRRKHYVTDIELRANKLITEFHLKNRNENNNFETVKLDLIEKIATHDYKLLFRDYIYPKITKEYPEFPLKLKDFNL